MLDIAVQSRPTWYWFNEHADDAVIDEMDSGAPCRPCTAVDGTAMYTGLGSAFHELVHTVVTPAWGKSDVLFREGIAHGLDGGHVVTDIDPPTEIAGGTKHGGAHFSRWLVDDFGPSKFRELFERLDASPTADEVFAVIEDVYGMPFPELEAEYFAVAPDVYPAPGLCDGLVHVPWQGNQWELYTTADCDAPHVFGPRDEDAAMVISVTLDLPDWPDVAWAAANEPDGIVTLTPCIEEPLYDVDDPDEAVRDRIAARLLQGSIPGGRYRLTFPVDGPGDVHLRLCPSNGEHPVAGEETTFDPCLPSG